MKRSRGEGADSANGPGRLAPSRCLAPKFAPRLLARSTSYGVDVLRAAGFSGARARDFEDFVAGGVAGGVAGDVIGEFAGDRGLPVGRVPLPDPAFREGLRRRLWRIQVLARRHRGFATH
jgi:hypothetical protein